MFGFISKYEAVFIPFKRKVLLYKNNENYYRAIKFNKTAAQKWIINIFVNNIT